MLDTIFSTQGMMVLLLGVYAGAMWLFLTSAPKVHTILVSDLEQARVFYEGQLQLPVAQVPLQYYGYEPALSGAFAQYLPTEARISPSGRPELWYQLHKNAQLHIVPGARRSENRNRHICFNRDCIEQVLLRVQMRGIRHKIRRDRPLEFLVKDPDANIIEIAEMRDRPGA